jgi:hypothetical protein
LSKHYQLKSLKLDKYGNEITEIVLKANSLSKLTNKAEEIGLRWKHKKGMLFGGYYVDNFEITYFPEVTYE